MKVMARCNSPIEVVGVVRSDSVAWQMENGQLWMNLVKDRGLGMGVGVSGLSVES